jgi:hypothetical protein
LIKAYPVLFVPIILRYLWPRRRETIGFGAAYAATGLLGFVPLFFGADLHAVLAPFRYQFGREPEFVMIIYGFLLPANLAEGLVGQGFRLGMLALAMSVAIATPIPDMSSLLRRCALILLVVVMLAVFFSPQWILWFAPLLLPLVRKDRALGWCVASLDAISYLIFPIWYLTDWIDPLGELLLFGRCVAFLAIGVQLVRREWLGPDRMRAFVAVLKRGGLTIRRAQDRS